MIAAPSDQLGDVLRDSELTEHHNIGECTTYRVGGTSRWFVDVQSEADLIAAAKWAATADVPVLVIGAGSNLLVSDHEFPGLSLRLGEAFRSIKVDGTRVVVGAAAPLPVVARRTVALGLTGFVWAVGVPGTVGGAVRMNAGGHGSDMAASLVNAVGLDLLSAEPFELSAADLGFGYRSSLLTRHHCVTSVTLQLAPGDTSEGLDALAEIVRWRREHQPGGQNAGSVFINPPGDSAGRLIDAAGCKGLRVGAASVSEKHANFIQVDEGGTSSDVRALMALVVERVAAAFSIELQSETHMLGVNLMPEQGMSA